MKVGQPTPQASHPGAPGRGFQHLEIPAEPGHVPGQPFEVIRPDLDDRLRSAGTHHPDRGLDPPDYLVQRGVHPNDGTIRIAGRGDALGHHAGRILEMPGHERVPGQHNRTGTVDPKGPPVMAIEVERHQVPPSVGRDQPMGFGSALGLSTVVGPVGEGYAFVQVTGPGKRNQLFGRNRFHPGE